MRSISGLSVLLLAGSEVFALSGTVKDNKGAAVEGATVFLASDTTVRQTTNASGAFTINKSVSIRSGETAFGGAQAVSGLAFMDGRLRFTLASPARSGAIALFTGDGRRLSSTPLGPVGAGRQEASLPALEPGLYVLRLTLDDYSGIARLVHTGGKGDFLLPAADGASDALGAAPDAPAFLRKSASAAVVDTLKVRKTGFATAKSPVASYDQTGIAVVLNPDTGGVPALPPISDYSANGPFTVVEEKNVGPGSAYTIYRPEPLGANGFLHAPMIYGHGINGQVTSFANFLKNVASHGFVIIGCNVLTGGPNSAANNTAMTNGLNWILQQHTTAGSKYQGKLLVKRASSMGYSVGGTAAVDIGGHEAILTVVSIHGHISTATLRGTLLQTSGTRDNVGLPMQQQTFTNSKVQTFLGTVTNADHGYISQNNGGVQRPAIVAWLRYWIYNDAGGKNYFYGNDCVMCKAPWENPQRKNWQ